ncbi:MAG: extracellular solute-binding protein [Fimbriimonas sp.]
MNPFRRHATMRALAILALLLTFAIAAAQRPTIRFWAVTGSVKDVDMYRRLADDFERETGIHVEVTPLAWGNFATKYFASMAAGLPPDIGVTNLGGPFDYGSVGGLVDLRAEFPEATKRLEAQFNPGMLDMYTVGDKLFGIPNDLGLLVLYYRKDIFAKLGLGPPKTWSELNRAIAKLEANRYRYYFGFTNNAQWAIGMYTMPYGLAGLRMGADGRPEVTWNDPGYQKGILQALRLWHMHDSPGKDLGSRAIGMFRESDPGEAIPLMVDLHSIAGQIEPTAPEMRGKWGVVPWPKADDGKPFHVMGGTTYVIFRQSKVKREAMRWLEYLNGMRAQRAMILDRADRGDEAGLFISPNNEVWSEANRDFWQDPKLQFTDPLREVVQEMLPAFRTVKSLHGTAEVGRMEANLLDQMGTYIRDRMDALGRDRDLTRSELVRRFGDGRMEAQRAGLEADIARKLREEYAKIQPKAQEILRQEAAHYEERYGDIVKDLPTYEARQSVLDVVKLGVTGVMLALVATVVAVPRLRKHLVSYAFVAAPLLLAVIFVFIPAITALYLSFTDYHPVLPLSTARWVGTENYAGAFQSGDLVTSVRHTLRYAIYTLPIGVVLALLFAYLLNSKLRGERFWRFLYFSPLVTSIVSIALIFSQLFLGGKQGWLNAVLLRLGLVKDPIPFLTSEHSFLNTVIVLAIWHGLAFSILVFLAGLQQIPEEQFEAAAIDGASAPRRFWNIAVPGVRPQLFFVTVLGLIGAFQVFETIYVLAGKSGDAGARFGPNDSALTMVPLIYHTGFETFEMGKSAAFAYILFVMILIVTALQFGQYRRKQEAM